MTTMTRRIAALTLAVLTTACSIPDQQPPTPAPIDRTDQALSIGSVACAIWFPCAVNAALLGLTTPHKNDISKSLEWASQQAYDGAASLRGWVAEGIGPIAERAVNGMLGNPLGAVTHMRVITNVLKGVLANVENGPQLAQRAFDKISKGGFGNVVDGVTDLYVALSVVHAYALLNNPDILLTLPQEALSEAQRTLGFETLGRKLTSAERAVLRPVFGDALNYDAVVVNTDHALVYSSLFTDRPFTAQNTIYFKRAANYDLRTLVHEVTHVWQFQTAGTRYKIDALKAQFLTHTAYRWDLAIDAHLGFDQMDPEQQAAFVDTGWTAVIMNGTPLTGAADNWRATREFAKAWATVSGGASRNRFFMIDGGIRAGQFFRSTDRNVCVIPATQTSFLTWDTPPIARWSTGPGIPFANNGLLTACTKAEMGIWPNGYYADLPKVMKLTGFRACHVSEAQWLAEGQPAFEALGYPDNIEFGTTMSNPTPPCVDADFRHWPDGFYLVEGQPEVRFVSGGSRACHVRFDQWQRLGMPAPATVSAADYPVFQQAFSDNPMATPCQDGELGL